MAKSSALIIHSLEMILMFTGAVCIAVIVTPQIFNIIAGAEVAEIRRSLQSWLRPPYVYVVINCIIISIAASSRLHKSSQNDVAFDHPYTSHDEEKAVYVSDSWMPETTTFDELETQEDGLVGNEDFVGGDDVSGLEVVEWKPTQLEKQETDEIVSSFFNSQLDESPLATSGHHSPSSEAATQGEKSLEEGNEYETLESTWKRITEGRLATRHLFKSDTWKNESRPLASSEPSTPSSVNKSKTFKDGRNNFSPSRAKLIKTEKSPSQEELNRRVEAFINKFKMRLQRQQCIQLDEDE